MACGGGCQDHVDIISFRISLYGEKGNYSVMADLLSVITSSDKRRKLLLLLQHEPKALDEIKHTLNVTATGMIPQIRILEKRNLVKQEGRKYALTELGHVVTTHLNPLVKTLEVIEKQEEFWCEHDIRSIPSPLLTKINELGDFQIIENSIEELYEPHKEFLDNIQKSKKVSGISPIVHPIYPNFFLQLAEKGTDISLILTRNAFNKIENEYKDLLVRGLSFNNAYLYVSDDDMKLACMVTDIYFSISLFFKNGVFDSRNDLVSFDESALLWGEELFNYYKGRSHKIENL